MTMLTTLLQSLNPYKGTWGRQYDSTQGTTIGFAWFVGAVFLVLIFGVIKAYRDDKKWRGGVLNRPQKPIRPHVYKFDS